MSQTETLPSSFDRFQKAAFVIGGVALALCGLGAVQQGSTQFLQSYLYAYLFWLGLAMGSFAFMMIGHLAGGRWSAMVLRILESAALTIPLMALLIIPLLLKLPKLYIWAQPEVLLHDSILQFKQPYLNPQFFILRTICYFLVWIVISRVVIGLSHEQDRTGKSLSDKIRSICGPGVVLYVLTMSFAAFDWAMSLTPHWFSSIYGVMFMVGQALSTLAFSIIIVAALSHHKPFSEAVSPDRVHDLGKLLFAFVILWTYVSYGQLVIIWSGNLPEETPWYLVRTKHGWEIISVVLIVFHFAVPFFVLLSRHLKRRIEILWNVALWILFMRLIDLFWIIKPVFSENLALHWMDIAAVVGIGGLWLAAFIWQLKRRPSLLPLHDDRLELAMGHH